MNELISVLMCVYNTRIDFLTEAVDSILNQSYRNIEFIIVDDSSRDEAVVAYLDRIACEDDRITLIRNEENLGLTKSLNIGLRHCSGKYIARMDSDDISDHERIEIQVGYMDQHTDVALVGCNVISFGDGLEEVDESLIHSRCDDPKIYSVRSLIQHSGPPHPTFMFRTSFLRENSIEYREDILKAQDYGIMADILKQGGIIRKIYDPLLRYRVHAGQITSSSEAEQKAYQCRVSHDFIKHTFPTLSEGECTVLCLLGCNYDIDSLIYTINNNDHLKKTCGFLLSDSKIWDNSDLYVNAVKKAIQYNNEQGLFDKSVFMRELRFEWWKKALRTSRRKKRPWGMWPYTLVSYLTSSCLERN